MKLFSLFKRKKEEEPDNDKEKEQSYKFSEKDREISLEKRRINRELKQTEEKIKIQEAKLKLRDLEDELNSYDEEEEEENELSGALGPYLPELVPAIVAFLNNGRTAPTPAPQQVQIQKIILSDEQIEEYYKENKKYIKFAKKMSDEQIKSFLLNRVPDLSDESILKIVARVRSS